MVDITFQDMLFKPVLVFLRLCIRLLLYEHWHSFDSTLSCHKSRLLVNDCTNTVLGIEASSFLPSSITADRLYQSLTAKGL